jgi:hypothetical protein
VDKSPLSRYLSTYPQIAIDVQTNVRNTSARDFSVVTVAEPGRSDREIRRPIPKVVDTWSDQVFAYWDKLIANAYTETVNGVAKGMSRMRRRYSFDVLWARPLYNPEARPATAVTIHLPVVDRESDGFMKFTIGRMVSGPTHVCVSQNASSSTGHQPR